MPTFNERELLGCAGMRRSFASRSAADLQRRAFPLAGDEPQYAPDRTIDITHMRLELRLDFVERRISGVAALSARALAATVATATLDAVELEVREVRLRRAGGAEDEPVNFEIGDATLRLWFATPLERGSEFELAISYSAQPERGLYFILPDAGYPEKQPHAWTQGQDLDARAWFPCHTLPDDKATSEVIATVPADMFALSNGELVARTDNRDGTATFHWRENTPHSAYLVTLAVGPFVELRDEWNGMPVTYYVLPGREEDARRAMRRTPQMIDYFSEMIGVPYPYEKYAQVCVSDFIFGGMENTSATTLTDTFLPDERVMPDFVNESLVSHELAHQWFGDLVTCREWSHGWLNEGFATYFESLWIEHAEGEDAFRYNLYLDALRYMAEDSRRYRRPLVMRAYSQPIDIFDMHLYPKGGWVLHMLRAQLGDDGWRRSLKQYVTKHRESTVLTHDFQRAIEEATGRNFEKFFEQFVFTGGHPEYKVSYSWDEAKRIATLKVRQQQALDALTPLFDLPVIVRFETSAGYHDFEVRIADAEHTLTFALPERPRLARFDVRGDLLKTLDFPRPQALLTYQLERDPTVIGRIEAAHELARLGTRAAVIALGQALLREPFWGVQAQIAQALGEARTPAAKEALLAGLSLSNTRARRAVVAALANFKRDETIADAVWQRFVDNDPSYYVEAEAAQAQGLLKAPQAFEHLVAALDRPSWNSLLQMHALIGLGELRDPRGVPVAIAWSAYGKALWARLGAITALGMLGALPAQTREAIEQLSALLDDPQLRVREYSARALGAIGDAAAIPALERAVARDRDGRVIRLAREAIAAIKAGASRSDELAALRHDVDRLIEENRKLRDRLDALGPNPDDHDSSSQAVDR
jgi:aminopeptidase N